MMRRFINFIRRNVLIFENYFYNSRHQNQPKVALVSCDIWKNKVFDDLLLARAFNRRGFCAEIISWQNSTVDYDQYSAIIVTSMWGYQDHLSEFKNWLSNMHSRPLFNSAKIIQNNYDKVSQLRLLQKYQIPTVTTMIIPPHQANLSAKIQSIKAQFQCQNIVVKPSISGSGKNTFIIGNSTRAHSHETLPDQVSAINKTKSLLVQPFIQDIDHGELAVVFIDGKLSHAIMRYPHIFNQAGDNHEVPVGELEPSLLQLCDKVLKIPEYQNSVYARIDFVKNSGTYKIMEVELLEPQLYYYLLKDRDTALLRMVSAIQKRLKK